MSSIPVFPVLLPMVGSAIALVGKLVPWKRTASVLAISSLIASAVSLGFAAEMIQSGGKMVYQLGGWAEPYGIAFHLDGVAWLTSVFVVVVSVVTAVAALARPGYGPNFFFFLLLLVAGMQSVVLTGDLFTMFVSFEVVAVAAYVLISFDGNPAGIVASFKYLILSSVGMLFFLFGVLVVYLHFGALSFSRIGEMAATVGLRPVRLAVAALCVGIGVRSGSVPFHTWLPEAHAHAPHPISALLSGVLIKVAFIAMIRILAVFSAIQFHSLLMWIGGVTAVVGVVMALSQTDAKRLLAYHSISQMGYIVAVFASAGALSTVSAFYHAMAHGLFKSLLFLTVGCAVRMTGERNLFSMPPVGRRAPVLTVAYLIGALSIVGVPPFNGYASKVLIAGAMGDSVVYALLTAASIGTVASFIKLSRIFLPARGEASAPASERGSNGRPGLLIHAPVLVLSTLCIVTGVLPTRLATLLSHLTGGLSAAGIGGTEIALPVFYSAGKLLNTALVTVAGSALYLLLRSHAAKNVLSRLRALKPDLRSVLLMFFFGLTLFGVVAYLPA